MPSPRSASSACIVSKTAFTTKYRPTPSTPIDLLWVVQISETTAGSSYAGMPVGDRVIRWELHGDQVLLRDVRYGVRADTADPIAQAVKASNLAHHPRVRCPRPTARTGHRSSTSRTCSRRTCRVQRPESPQHRRDGQRAFLHRRVQGLPRGTSTCACSRASPRESRAAERPMTALNPAA